MDNADTLPQPRLVDIAAIHKTLPEGKPPLGNFFRTNGYRTAHKALIAEGYTKLQLVRRSHASPGNPVQARVHPLIALEYLRWADYRLYSKRLSILLAG